MEYALFVNVIAQVGNDYQLTMIINVVLMGDHAVSVCEGCCVVAVILFLDGMKSLLHQLKGIFVNGRRSA